MGGVWGCPGSENKAGRAACHPFSGHCPIFTCGSRWPSHGRLSLPPHSVLGPLEAPPAPGPAWLCAAALHLELRQAGKAGLRSELARLPCPGDEARTTGTGSGF